MLCAVANIPKRAYVYILSKKSKSVDATVQNIFSCVLG